MNLSIIGTGYVGLVAGACFAETGNEVMCVDIDEAKIARLKKGEIPIFEPGLSELVHRNVEAGRLRFTTSMKEGVEHGQVIMIAVGTPPKEDGSADLKHVLTVARDIGTFMNEPKLIIDKSTVPVGTAALVTAEIRPHTKHQFEVISNPEFLKEGNAVEDFLKPDRVVIGCDSAEAGETMKVLYTPFVKSSNSFIVMDVVSAEMTKYAANAMLATRISFMNEMAMLCEAVGANVEHVRVGIGSDTRIGIGFLNAGLGYGGSCFPKDVRALLKTANDSSVKMKVMQAVEDANKAQRESFIKKIVSYYNNDLSGKTFGIWGLSFKPNTDDTREAPALDVIRTLVNAGATVKAFDPEAKESFETRFGEHRLLSYAHDTYEAITGADALIVCTEWQAFRHPNFTTVKTKMSGTVIFDGRNIYRPEDVTKAGLTYISIGRKAYKPGLPAAQPKLKAV